MTHAFESLTPDTVLDALESVGLRGDGRLTALSSYENRVYQAVLEDGSQVVASFTGHSAGARLRFWKSMRFRPN
jgi:Ser/Thr protein kinase RdoA (MazF antagonist)